MLFTKKLRQKAVAILIILSFFVTAIAPSASFASADAGLSVTQADNAEQLVNEMLGSGITASNIVRTGKPVAFGLFSGGMDAIGFDQGIILSTGKAADVVGPNDEDDKSTDNGNPGDADLTALAGLSTHDAAILEFDFVPNGDSISFQYVFSSEEYNEYANSGYNDTFAFFVNGKNVALIPDTDPPIPVSINTVNGGNPVGSNAKNPDYFINNDRASGAKLNTQMDGLTVVMSVSVGVKAGETNHIKIAIADGGDSTLDSNVFIKAGSFNDRPARPGELTIIGKDEREDTIDIYVERRDGSDSVISVKWTAKDAEGNPVDNGTVKFNDGETGKYITVPASTKTIVLADPKGGATIDPDSVTKHVDEIPPIGGEPSVPPAQQHILANGTKDTVRVEHVPAGATVIVYNEANQEIGRSVNHGTEPATVVVTGLPDLQKDQLLYVTITEDGKQESIPTAVVVTLEKSAAPAANDVSANATTDRVTVNHVPAHTTVTVYDAVYSGETAPVLATATNASPTEASVMLEISGMKKYDIVHVTFTEPNKLESDPTAAVAFQDRTETLTAGNVRASSTAKQVVVNHVPYGAAISVYDFGGAKLLNRVIQAEGNGPATVTVSLSVYAIAYGDELKVTMTEVEKDESFPLTVSADMDPTPDIASQAVSVNTAANEITVGQMPAATVIIVYDDRGNEIGRAVNNGASKGSVTVTNIAPALKAGEQVRLVALYPNHSPSTPLPVTVPLTADSVTVDVISDMVTVNEVRPGSTIIVYDPSGHELGRRTNHSKQPGTVQIQIQSGIEHEDLLFITVQSQDGPESGKISVIAKLTDDQLLDEAARLLKIGFSDGDTWESVTSSLFLVTAGAYGTDVAWSSSKPNVVTIPQTNDTTITAAVNRQSRSVSVILTAVISKNGVSKEKTFLLVIKPVGVTKEDAGTTRTVVVKDQNDAAESIPVTRINVTHTDNTVTKIDKVIFTAAQAQQLTAKAGPGSNTSTIYIDEVPGDEADEIAVEIPAEAVGLLARHNYSLNVQTVFGTIRLQGNVLSSLNHNNTDLYFRLVPVKQAEEQEKIVHAVPAGYTAVGKPLEVETNYRGFVTTLFIPFERNGVDPNRVQPEKLAVYIEHSDGEKVVDEGNAVYDGAGNPLGIEIVIDKFSTFTVVEQRSASTTPVISPTTEQVKAELSAGGVTADVEILRTSQRDGTKKDELVLTASQVEEALKKASDDTVKKIIVRIPDERDEVSETNITVRKDAVRKLIDHQTDFVVGTRNGWVELKGSELEGADQDVTIRIVPQKGSAQHQEILGKMKESEETVLIGYPLSVETNLSKPITVVFPLTADDAILVDQLAVYMETEDGMDWLPGRVVELTEGVFGYAVSVTGSAVIALVKSDAGSLPEVSAGSHQAYVHGYPNGLFGPERAITRAELAAIVARNLSTGEIAASGASSFVDVAQEHWAAAYIEMVSAKGLMVGDPAGTFRPDEEISRAELAQIGVRYKAIAYDTSKTASTVFSDVSEHWAAGAIDAAYNAGIMVGYKEGDFRPNRPVTRAEAVTAMNRLFERGPLHDVPEASWEDVPVTHWAFKEIEEAGRDHHFTKGSDGIERLSEQR